MIALVEKNESVSSPERGEMRPLSDENPDRFRSYPIDVVNVALKGLPNGVLQAYFSDGAKATLITPQDLKA